MEKLLEWELTSYCTFKCFYCSLKNVKTETNKIKIEEFISTRLKNDILNGADQVFIFGGEPLIHPEIEFILRCLNKHNIPYIIQTQLSKPSIDVILSLPEDIYIPLNISVHLTEQTIDEVKSRFNIIKDRCCFKKVDVMFSKSGIHIDYLKLKLFFDEYMIPCRLTPIASFSYKNDGADDLLKQYNIIRKHKLFSKLIIFETTPPNLDKRSYIWEKQITKKFSTIGKPCLYKGRYKIYNSNLESFTCHRQKNVDICEDRCFLM